MKMTEIPIKTDTLGTIPKYLVRELEDLEIGGLAEVIKSTALLRSARIQRNVLVDNNNIHNWHTLKVCWKSRKLEH